VAAILLRLPLAPHRLGRRGVPGGALSEERAAAPAAAVIAVVARPAEAEAPAGVEADGVVAVVAVAAVVVDSVPAPNAN